MNRTLSRIPPSGHAYMMPVIALTWLVLAVTDLSQTAVYSQRLSPILAPDRYFTHYSGDVFKYGKPYFISIAAGFLFMIDLPTGIYHRVKYRLTSAVALLTIFWLYICCMKMGADDLSLHFRF